MTLAARSAPPGDTGEPPATEGSLRVLTYNVHGFPPGLTGDDTPARMEAISPLLNDFEVVGIQEDWDERYQQALLGERR